VESCAVTVEPHIDSNVEQFTFPLDGIKEFGLDLASTENGFIVAGKFFYNVYSMLNHVSLKSK